LKILKANTICTQPLKIAIAILSGFWFT